MEAEVLLIRGGTTSIGLAAIAIAKHQGASVIATTPKKERTGMLEGYGADFVVIDTGSMENQIRGWCSHGVDAVLELVGATPLDSAACVRIGGRIDQDGAVGGRNYTVSTVVKYAFYSGDRQDFHVLPLQELVDMIADGRLSIKPSMVFDLEQIQEAHRGMEDDRSGGKLVVLTSGR